MAYRFDGCEVTRHAFAYEAPATTSSLGEITHALDTEFDANRPEPTANRMEQIVDAIGRPQQFGRLAGEIVDDPEKLAAVAAVSEKHPLGFYKIPLA